MSDLPTREEAQGILLVKDLMISNNSDAVAIISAYVEGRLIDRVTIDYEAAHKAQLERVGILVHVTDERLSRAEWEATIDYKPAVKRLVEWAYEPEGMATAAEATIQIVDAAVKGET